MTQGDWFWHELMTPDMDAASAFYQALFDWKTADWTGNADGAPSYKLWVHGDNPAHGGAMKMDRAQSETTPPHWMIYVKIDNADETAVKIEQLGGTVILGPVDVPSVGRVLMAQDPTGAHIGMIEPAPQN